MSLQEATKLDEAGGVSVSVVKPIPDTYPRITPHLTIDGAANAIEFYQHVFGARERVRMGTPDGLVAHAEIELGGSVLMIGEANLPIETDPSPKSLGGSPVSLFVYVEDVDDVFRRAVDGGAKPVSEPEDHFYGDRVATIDDPFGHRWNIATHIEDVPPDEMERRAARAMAGP
ncbi:MAG TPA: VOC family protein [Actinomycetota bacterium]|nr:VOC family protein [Actinomycetota bacterium]